MVALCRLCPQRRHRQPGRPAAGFADDQRGERLVVLYTQGDLSPADLWQQISETDLPRLWLPKRENFCPVEAHPLLSTGKLDLRGLKTRAQELAGVNVR